MSVRKDCGLPFVMIAVWLMAPAVRATDARDADGVSPLMADLAVFESLIGPWAVAETHYDRFGKVVATVSGSEEVSWTLDKHAIRRTYTSGEENPPYRAIGTITWDDVAKQYAGVWFDNRATSGPRIVSGEWNAETRTFIWTFQTRNPDGKSTQFRRIERLINEEERVATTFELADGEVIKRLEVRYRRTIPCPSSGAVRTFMEGVGGGRG